MKHAHVSYRIHYKCWHQEKTFEELFAMIRDIRPAEEYALFTDENHSPVNLAEMLRRFEVMGERIARLRTLNVRVGINVLNTLGHRGENLAYAALMKRKFTGQNGYVYSGVACPADPEWYENYLKPVYQAAAKIHPDFIWIDDDFRLKRGGLVGCFCPDCRRELHEATGLPEDLEELTRYFDCPDPAEARIRREKILDWERNVMISGAGKIEKYIHEVDENIVIGQMDSVWCSWGGGEYRKLYQTLAGKNSAPVWWRPGGGIYRNRELSELIDKASALGKEGGNLPEEVEVLEGELENFNYQPLHKSISFAAIEPQLFCAAGLTGVAYNIFSDPEIEEFSTYIPLVKKLKKITPFLDQMVSDNGRATPCGIHDCCITLRERLVDRDDPAASWLDQENWLADICKTDLLKIGLPQGFDFAGAKAYIMRGKIVQSLEHDEIIHVLSRGVYLDGAALALLNKLGYGEYTGFEVEKSFDLDTVERYSSHPLNGSFAGKLRSVRQNFWPSPAWSLKPAPGAEIVSSLEDLCGREIAPCASGCFVNALGGKVFVAGYGAWQNIFNSSKVCQLKNIFNFLSSDTLPGWVESVRLMAIWVRELANGGSCEVFNSSLDTIEDATVALRTAATRFTLYSADGRVRELEGKVRDGISRIVLPELAPGEVVHITWQNP